MRRRECSSGDDGNTTGLYLDAQQWVDQGAVSLLATIADSTVSGNTGDGIVNTGATLTLSGSTLSDNGGAGLSHHAEHQAQASYHNPSTTVSNSTISGNTGPGIGGVDGAWFGLAGGFSDLQISYSTITDNLGGGVVVPSNDGFGATTVAIAASLVADSGVDDVGYFAGPSGLGPDPFTSGGFNVIGTGNATGAFTGVGDVTAVTDPGLDALGDNGGPTNTHALAATSPAVDRVMAPVSSDPGTDQRGVARAFGAGNDAGAVERDLWIRPFGTVISEGHSGTSTADVVVYLEDSFKNPMTAASDVTIDYATVDAFPNPRVAQAGSDFVSTAGTLTIPAGASEGTVPVEIIGDTTYEPNLLYGEWGLVTFSNVSPNARLNLGFFGLGLIIIGNDDNPPP
jgi:hypothetical protein